MGQQNPSTNCQEALGFKLSLNVTKQSTDITNARDDNNA